MEISQELSELWELFGELCEEAAKHLHGLSERVASTPQVSTWLTVWLGVVWISMRWSRIVAERGERRIYDAAESRLSVLVLEGGGDAPPDSADAAALRDDAQGASPTIRQDGGETAGKAHTRVRHAQVEQ